MIEVVRIANSILGALSVTEENMRNFVISMPFVPSSG